MPKQSKVKVGLTSGMPPNVRKLLMAAQSHLDGSLSLDEKAAIRRAARTSDWTHDPERLAAAEAKRARKRAKRAYAAD